MPKKILFESAVHQFAVAARRLSARAGADARAWERFLDTLHFQHAGRGQVDVSWEAPRPGSLRFGLEGASLYLRGDSEAKAAEQEQRALVFAEDAIERANAAFFGEVVERAATLAGVLGGGPSA